MKRLIDTHYHLDFIVDENIRRLTLQQLALDNIEVVAQTILPSNFVKMNEQFEWPINTTKKLSLGFHPWHLNDIDNELEIFKNNLSQTKYIGEIGLDFVPKRLDKISKSKQIEVFSTIMKWLCEYPSQFVVSIHAVRSELTVIEILEQLNVVEYGVTPIIHRFNGTSDDLVRFIKLGGYISVHSMMLSSKKGRAYIRQIPVERLLLETDLPNDEVDFAGVVKEQLYNTLCAIDDIKKCEMQMILQQTQSKLYNG